MQTVYEELTTSSWNMTKIHGKVESLVKDASKTYEDYAN